MRVGLTRGNKERDATYLFLVEVRILECRPAAAYVLRH